MFFGSLTSWREVPRKGQDGARTMKTNPRIVAAIVVTLLPGGAWLTAPSALAADAILYPNPVEPAPLATGWWYHYYVEGGVREFLNNPQRDGVTALGGK